MSRKHLLFLALSAVVAGLAVLAVLLVAVAVLMQKPLEEEMPPTLEGALVIETPAAQVPDTGPFYGSPPAVELPRASVPGAAAKPPESVALHPELQGVVNVVDPAEAQPLEGQNGLEALTSSRVMSEMELTDAQHIQVADFEQRFAKVVTQRLQPTSEQLRQATRQWQAAMQAQGDENSRLEVRRKQQEAFAAHLQAIEALEKEYLAGVQPLLNGDQFEDLQTKVASRPRVSAMVTTSDPQDRVEVQVMVPQVNVTPQEDAPSAP